MKRRTILVGLGCASIGASTLVGSGAFSSAQIQRDASIAVSPDSDALVGLGPCPKEDRTSAYVVEESGQIAIQISEENDAFEGEGVNVESVYWFDNVLEVCNQSDHDICIDFGIEVPEIPGSVPDHYEFEQGDPAVVFYRGDDRNEPIDVSSLDPKTEGIHLGSGECLCIGFTTRAFGFDAGTDIFEDTSLTITAFAGDECKRERDDEDEDDEDDETDIIDDLKGISFVAFCPKKPGKAKKLNPGVTDVLAVDDGAAPVEVGWESETPVHEIVVKAGTEWYRFDVDGQTSGTVMSSADGAQFGDERTADAKKELKGDRQTFRFDDDPELTLLDLGLDEEELETELAELVEVELDLVGTGLSLVGDALDKETIEAKIVDRLEETLFDENKRLTEIEDEVVSLLETEIDLPLLSVEAALESDTLKRCPASPCLGKKGIKIEAEAFEQTDQGETTKALCPGTLLKVKVQLKTGLSEL